jgi:PhoPQ-activated pathogenicity-related protein
MNLIAAAVDFYKDLRVRFSIWELRVRANLAHFLLSGGENYPLALVTYDINGEIDTITYGRDQATLNYINKKLKYRHTRKYRGKKNEQ